MMLVIIATVPVQSEKVSEATELLSDVAQQSRDEEGIIDYRVSVDVDDENIFKVIEIYENEDAFNSHMQKEHTQDFVEALPNLAGGEIEAKQFEVDSMSDLEL